MESLEWFDKTDMTNGGWMDIPDTMTTMFFKFKQNCPITSCELRNKTSDCVTALTELPNIRVSKFFMYGM